MHSYNEKLIVFANGIWKSGNNLLMKLLEIAGYKYSDFGLAASSVYGPYFILRQVIRGAKYSKNPIPIGLDIPVNVSIKWLSRKIKRLNGNYFSGHAAYSERLFNILETNNIKTIQIIRDPRDIVVSYSQWILKRPDYYTFKHFSNLEADELHEAS